MDKHLPQLVKYIFTSGEEWTGVWFLMYRAFTSIGMNKIVQVLADKICIIIVGLLIQPMRKTYKSSTSDECILGIRKETQARMLSLLISKAKKKACKQPTKRFCSDSLDS